jgi:hypothetical protein
VTGGDTKGPTFYYSIQSHDFKMINVDDPSLNEAIQAFETFDWQAELKAFEAKKDDSNYGPPCISFQFDKTPEHPVELMLLVCPIDETAVEVHLFISTYNKKLFGLFSFATSEDATAERCDKARVPELIRFVFERKVDGCQ